MIMNNIFGKVEGTVKSEFKFDFIMDGCDGNKIKVKIISDKLVKNLEGKYYHLAITENGKYVNIIIT
jgi:hypothetical protein